MQLSIDFLTVSDQLSHALRLCASYFPAASIKTLKIKAPQESRGDALFQRVIIESPWDQFGWARKVSFLKFIGEQLPSFILQNANKRSEPALIFTEGRIPPLSDDFIYLYDVQSTNFLHLYRKHDPKRLAVSSQSLKEQWRLPPETRVIPPPIPTEDFPYIESPFHKQTITILLPKDSVMDLSWIAHVATKYTVQVLGGQSEALAPMREMFPQVVWNANFCHGTIHTAFLESFIVFDFLSPKHFPTYGLLALANRCLVATPHQMGQQEFLPTSAAFYFAQHPAEVVATLALVEQVYLSLDWAEMRRYALRFNEKNFKDRMKRWLDEGI